MLRQENFRNCMESQSLHCEDGRIAGKSTLSDLLEIKDCTRCQKKSLQKVLENRESFIFEYLLRNRKTILNDKELTWLLDIQTMKLFQTLDQESTGSEKAFLPFWTQHSKETSKRLWLPRETDCVASPLSSSNGSFEKQGLGSWCLNKQISPLNKNCQTTSSPLCRYFAAAEMESDMEIFVMRRIKLNPTKEQKSALRKFADGARFTYNQTVERIEDGAKVNKMELRNSLVTKKDNHFFDDKAWLLETPKAIRQQAVFEACKSYKTCFSNLKAKNIKKFKMKFKSKKSKTWTIGIERAIEKGRSEQSVNIFPSYLGSVRHYGALPFQTAPATDCSIHKDARDRYFLQVPVKRKSSRVSYSEKPVVALDPGVRKFLTGFRSDAMAFTLGDDFASKLMSILKYVDAIDSQMKQSCCKRRQQLRKKKMHLFGKYKDLRDEFHWKVINWLTKEHSLILIPHLQTQKLSQTPRTKGNREMLAVGHYTFLERLKFKCKERNVGLMIVDESYTTKTCGCCGTIVNIGAAETFTCSDCTYSSDRDVNAARNILLKHMRVVSIGPLTELSNADAHLRFSSKKKI